MKKIQLGNTGIEVSELCFGVLPIGPMQKNVPVDEAAETLAYALENGITFLDTAQAYKTYEPIRIAMEKTGIRPVIASKSMASDYEGMERAVLDCLEALNIDCVDIFFLHAARAGTDVFEVRGGAHQALLDYKAKGKIKAVGISTHDRRVVEIAAGRDYIDVVFPIINKAGLGILNGTREEMENAIASCVSAGKGVYFMKALGGGNLAGDYVASLDYARNLHPGQCAIALGLVNIPEVAVALSHFNGEDVTEKLKTIEVPHKEFFVLQTACVSCGKCVDTCHSSAIELQNGIPVFDQDKCLTCGYCVTGCPQFAIRMV